MFGSCFPSKKSERRITARCWMFMFMCVLLLLLGKGMLVEAIILGGPETRDPTGGAMWQSDRCRVLEIALCRAWDQQLLLKVNTVCGPKFRETYHKDI